MRHLFLLISFSLIASSAFAQYGKIRGVVTDAETGETIIGASVIIEGTTKGNATDIDGEYIIIAVESGTHNLVVSYVGYKKTIIENVQVSMDLTTEINVALQPLVVEGQEVTVVAERELVRMDVTASLSSVTSEQIEAIPVENFSEVVELQAGVVDGHFRGGRGGEVGYWIDGVPVTDVFDGSLSAGIENSAVQEVQVVTGAFSAEYGQAMSGIVNIVTKDGDNSFSGNISTFAGDYASSRTNLFRNIDTIDPLAVRNLEGSLSGPIIKDKLFFFTNLRYFKNDGWFYGRRVFDFNDVGYNEQGMQDLLNETGSGDSSVVNMNPYEKINGQLKLTWRPVSGLKISLNGMMGTENFKNYNHSAQFMPQFSRKEFAQNHNIYLKATHTFSETTFYDISLSNSYKEYESYLFEDPYDERYRPNPFAGFRMNNITSGFIIGGTDNGRTRRETNTYIAKFDITSQVNNENQVKSGVEFRQHNLKLRDVTSLVETPTSGVTEIFENAVYDVDPIELSAYIQDKVEIGNLIINAGVRYDYFDANHKVFKDPNDPSVVLDERRPEDESLVYMDSEPNWQLSPRLGIAFPISETGVVHFSYGHFFQTPNFSLLYQNPFFRLGEGGSGLIGLIGNANLKPQKTVNGELGYKQELGNSAAVEITAYFRDIRNLAGTATDPISINGTSARYGMLRNSDFGFVKGVVLSFEKAFRQGLFLTADYTFQVAKGNSSDPDQAYNALAAEIELEKTIVPLNWDQRHTVNVTASYASKTGWGAGAIFSAGSAFPYSPDYDLRSGETPSENPVNNQRKPAIYNLDFNVSKDIKLTDNQSLQIYAKVDNVLDRGNERGVFDDTGRAIYSLNYNKDLKNFRGDMNYLNSNYTRPDFYNEPRRIVFGLSYRF